MYSRKNGTMRTVLIFVCMLSYVSGREMEINEMIVEHIHDLLSELVISSKPEQKSGFVGQEKILCILQLAKYTTCKAMCIRMSLMSMIQCKSIMFARFLKACFTGNLECFGDPVTTTTPPMPGIATTTLPVTSGNCGISPDTNFRVTGGTPVVKSDRYPWQVGLSLTAGTARDYVCSGTVITRRHILTAASCFRNGEIYTIGFGSALEKEARFERTQTEVKIHEKFRSGTMEYNVAIIEFSTPINFERNNISPMCLPGNANDNLRVSAIVTGWGNINNVVAAAPVDTLHEARVQIDECPDINRYTDNMICTTVGTPAKDACKGDAGGPLIRQTNGKFQQIGIISHGFGGCMDPTSAERSVGVYVKVGNFVDWIKKKVAPEITHS